MKNKKIVIIITALVIIGIAAIVAALCLSKKLIGTETFEMGDYKITVKAKKAETQNSDSYFTTEFETESDYIYKYQVEFQSIDEGNKENGFVYELRATDMTVKIGDTYIYGYYDLGDAPSSMTMYYHIESSNKYIIIKVKGVGVYTKDGSQLKMMPNIKNDKKLQNSEDLKRILDIKVEKN